MYGKIETLTILTIAVLIAVTGKIPAGIPETGSCDRLRYGDNLWRAGKFYESQVVYSEVAESTNQAVIDRIGALQRLALQAWLMEGKADSALALLKQAIDLGEAKALSRAMMSRFLLHDGCPDSAIILSKKSLNECKRLSDSLQAIECYGEAVFEQQKKVYLSGEPNDTLLLQDAMQKLNTIGFHTASEAYLWKLSLGLSLLLHDGPSALQAWRKYIEMGPNDSLFTSGGQSVYLPKALSSWKGGVLDMESCRSLVECLAASRLFGYASLIASTPEFPFGEELRGEQSIADILDYADLIEQARALVNAIYRKRLVADTTIAMDIQQLMVSAYNYWQTLEYPGERPDFSTDEMGTQLSRRWGAVFSSVDFSPTGFDMTWGHTVKEEVREIEQYGHQIEVRLVDVDQMISTGMMGWLTDGDVQVGGWTPTPEAIYRIRPAWSKSGIRAWETVSSLEKQKRIEERIHHLQAVDDSLAEADPYANLPGTNLRIYFASIRKLYDSLVSRGQTGRELQRNFLNEYRHLLQETSIVAHEGRHAIDMAFYGDEFEEWDATGVELRGKLSEILFSPNPWFSVGNSSAVFYGSDTTSGHGLASYLIRKHLVGWMDNHADEIEGFNRLRPTLAQIDLLSTEQLLRALKALDPLAQSSE